MYEVIATGETGVKGQERLTEDTSSTLMKIIV